MSWMEMRFPSHQCSTLKSLAFQGFNNCRLCTHQSAVLLLERIRYHPEHDSGVIIQQRKAQRVQQFTQCLRGIGREFEHYAARLKFDAVRKIREAPLLLSPPPAPLKSQIRVPQLSLESFPKNAVLLHPMLRRGIDLRDPGHALCQLGSDLLQVADKLCPGDPRTHRISVLANFRDDSQRGPLFHFEQHLNVVAVKEIDVFDFLYSGKYYGRQVTPRFRPCHPLPPSFADSPLAEKLDEVLSRTSLTT